MADIAPDVERFLTAVPKVELHLHLVGSASLDTLAALADRHGDPRVPSDRDDLRRYFEFRDFPHFIEVYATANDLVRDAADVVALIRGAAEDLASHGARYAEMTVTPYMHVIRGMPEDELLDALVEGRRVARAAGVEMAWIFDIPGEHGQPAAQRTLDLALRRQPEGLVGFGLAGAEAGVDRAGYRWAFDKARAAGLRSVPHAGEGDGPASVWAAIDDLGADRVGHGVRAIEDPALVDTLAERRVPLEVCPSSNVCTKVFASLEEHPIMELHRRGVIVTINTDDPHMFGTDLTTEYRRVAATFDLSVDDLASFVRNAIAASFLDTAHKSELLAAVNDAVAAAQLP
jgi:aminodeoxyfutalosine deaminase